MKWFKFTIGTSKFSHPEHLVTFVTYELYPNREEGEKSTKTLFGRAQNKQFYGYATMEEVKERAKLWNISPESKMQDLVNNPKYYGQD